MLFGVVICLIVMLAARVDHYRFLGGRKPVFGGVIPHRYSHTPPFGVDYSVYSWEQDYHEVVIKAKRELATLGYKIESEDSRGVTWIKYYDDFIGVFPGRSRDKNDIPEPKNKDNRWVTVQTSNPAEDSWATQLRSELEPDLPE